MSSQLLGQFGVPSKLYERRGRQILEEGIKRREERKGKRRGEEENLGNVGLHISDLFQNLIDLSLSLLQPFINGRQFLLPGFLFFFLFCFVLFCFVLFCFVLFCFVLFCDREVNKYAKEERKEI